MCKWGECRSYLEQKDFDSYMWKHGITDIEATYMGAYMQSLDRIPDVVVLILNESEKTEDQLEFRIRGIVGKDVPILIMDELLEENGRNYDKVYGYLCEFVRSLPTS
jgi:DNA-binding ferritin-like protein (Dps family)